MRAVAPSLLAAAADAQFSAWHIFLADERYVPIDHADSNMGEWKARLLDQCAIPASQIYPLDISLPLADAATAYEAQLRSVCGGGVAV